MASFKGVDYLQIDSLFNEEETAGAADGAAVRRRPHHPRHQGLLQRRAASLWTSCRRWGNSASSAPTSKATAARDEQRRVRPDHAGTGARRFRPAQLRIVQGALVMYPIQTYGSEEQQKKWLPELAAGKAIGCFGLTEPDFGSNPAGMRPGRGATATAGCSTARRRGSPTARVADVAVVWARAEEGIRGFLVERGTPGYHHVGHSRQVVDARLGDLEPVVRRLPRAGVENRLPAPRG